MKWIIPFLAMLMGWTDDPDEEGLIEENPFTFIVVAIIGLVAVTILYAVGIEYNPGWFEGQNLLSTMGIIFLLVFVPAIAISTLTGKSDLVKWEAIFLFLSVFMIFLGNNFDIVNALQSRFSEWMNIDWNVKDLLTIILIITLMAMAISGAMGKGISPGAAILAGILIVAIYLLNSGYTLDSFFAKFGTALHKGTSGFIGANIGHVLGVGLATAAAGAAIGSIVPGLGTGVGAVVGFLAGMGMATFAGW